MLGLTLMGIATAAVPLETELIVLSYHDVGTKKTDLVDEHGVTVDQLSSHLAWLRHYGYVVVSLDDVLKAQRGERKLPPQAVLLTFDDGLASFYTHAFPLLQLFDYPAVVAVVGRWHEDIGPWPLAYGKRSLNRNHFLNAEQLRFLAQSPLIEFASHSYDLHRGLVANASGQMQPAAVVRQWNPKDSQRETGQAYHDRITQDLKKSIAHITQISGRPPRAMVWPFGEYTAASAQIAQSLGLVLNMSLTSGVNFFPARFGNVRRFLISNQTTLNALSSMFAKPSPPIVRSVSLRLDRLVDVPSAQFERTLDLLVERVHSLGATHVLIPALTQENQRAVFQSQHLRSADILNRVAWQLRTRAGTKVFARWNLRDFEHSSAGGDAMIRAFTEMLETVPLTGVVLDFDAATYDEKSVERASMLAKLVRDTHPDDEIVWGVTPESAPKVLEHLGAGKSSPNMPEAIIVRMPPDSPPAMHLLPPRPLNAGAADIQIWHEVQRAVSSVENTAALTKHLRSLQRNRQLSFGWTEDDFVNNVPVLSTIAPSFSARTEIRE